MVIYLYGPDAYRRTEKAKSILTEYEKKHSRLNIGRFDIEEKGAQEKCAEFLSNISLFEPTKLAVLSHIEDVDKKFNTVLKGLLDDAIITLVILAEKKLGKDWSWLQKAKLSQEFEHFEGAQYLAWAGREAETRGAKLDRTSLGALCEAYIDDSWGLITELEKIALGGVLGKHLSIPDFFPLVQRVKGGKSVSERLSALGYALEGEDPAAIFNVAASLADAGQKVVFADYDVMVKSGKLEYEEALTDFVLRA